MVRASNLRTRQLFWASFISAGIHLAFGQQYLGLISLKNGIATYAFYFDLEIINRGFNSSLLDPTSEYYNTTKSEVDVLLTAAFTCSTCMPNPNAYKGTNDMTFQSGNLLIANMIIFFEFDNPTEFITPSIIQYYVDNVDENYSIRPLMLNTTFTKKDYIKPVTVGTTTTTPTTTELTTTTTATTTTTPPITTPSSTTPSSNTATTSDSTSGPDDATTDHSASASASATPLQNTTGTALTSDIDHLNSTSTPASVTPRHLIESTNTTTTATTTGYPLVPYWFDWVPGWAIALLVLASLILLLLIILLVLLLVRWCCLDEPEDQPIKSGRPDPYHSPYLSHSSARTPILNMTNQPMTPDKPKEGRAGMYVVNP